MKQMLMVWLAGWLAGWLLHGDVAVGPWRRPNLWLHRYQINVGGQRLEHAPRDRCLSPQPPPTSQHSTLLIQHYNLKLDL